MRTRALVCIVVALVSALTGACGGEPPPRSGGLGSGGSGDEVVEYQEERDARRGPPATPDVEQAEGLLASGDAAGALPLLDRAIAADAHDARAQLDRGLAFEMLERPEDAEAAYRAAIAANATFAEPRSNLGLLLRSTGHLDEAAAMLREAVRLKPTLGSAHLNLALVLEDQGDIEGAVAAYHRVMELAPRDPASRTNLGLLLVRAGRQEDAARVLLEALPLARGNRAFLAGIGAGLRQAGHAEEALSALRQAIDASEDTPSAALLAELALAQRATGDRAAAEATLGQVLAQDARFAIAHYLLGNLLAARGAFAEAIPHWERYLQLEPNGSSAAEARERIGVARQRLRANPH